MSFLKGHGRDTDYKTKSNVYHDVTGPDWAWTKNKE